MGKSKPSDRRSFGAQEPFRSNPFEALSSGNLQPPESTGEQPSHVEPSNPVQPPPAPAKSRGRVEIRRLKARRGGKTVTEVSGFIGIGLPEKEKLAKEMQRSCGVGGTVKEGRIEIQGDKRQEVARILVAAGFRPVFAGG